MTAPPPAATPWAERVHRDPYCATHCREGSRHSQCGCPCDHREPAATPSPEPAVGARAVAETALGPIEAEVLAALRDWTGPNDCGWHVNEGQIVAHLSTGQITAALGRLQRKGLVTCLQWHPGQGGTVAEWLWFPTSEAPSGGDQ